MRSNEQHSMKWLSHGLLAAAFVLAACGGGEVEQDTAPPAAPPVSVKESDLPRAEIIEPAEGAELSGPNVTVVLGAHNIVIAPAGDTTPGSAHHHLFVNGEPVAAGVGIPAGQTNIVHLGKAQTSYELTGLTPGAYTVIAVLGDFVHRRVEPQVLDTVRFRIR